MIWVNSINGPSNALFAEKSGLVSSEKCHHLIALRRCNGWTEGTGCPIWESKTVMMPVGQSCKVVCSLFPANALALNP